MRVAVRCSCFSVGLKISDPTLKREQHTPVFEPLSATPDRRLKPKGLPNHSEGLASLDEPTLVTWTRHPHSSANPEAGSASASDRDVMSIPHVPSHPPPRQRCHRCLAAPASRPPHSTPLPLPSRPNEQREASWSAVISAQARHRCARGIPSSPTTPLPPKKASPHAPPAAKKPRRDDLSILRSKTAKDECVGAETKTPTTPPSPRPRA